MSDPDITTLRSLQDSLNASIDSHITLTSTSNTSPSALADSLQHISKQASDLASLTSNPTTTNIQLGFGPFLNGAVRVAIDLDLFELITSTPVSLSTLAAQTHASPILLFRLLRLLTSHGYFAEVSSDTYKSTALSSSLRSPPIRDWLKIAFDVSLPIISNLPTYLSSISYRNPGADADTLSPAHFTFGCSYFDHLQAHPAKLHAFNTAMAMQNLAPPLSIPHFPFPSRLSTTPLPRGSSSAVLLVDVAGGHGSYITSLLKAHPTLPNHGRLILQDLPAVISSIDRPLLDPYIEPTPHDFFTPQPTVGARFYYLRRILHDWSDAACARILANLAPALTRGYSTLLVHDLVLPDAGCEASDTLRDANMMTVAGMERNRGQWEELLGAAGFRIREIHRAERGSLAIIEAELEVVDGGTKL